MCPHHTNLCKIFVTLWSNILARFGRITFELGKFIVRRSSDVDGLSPAGLYQNLKKTVASTLLTCFGATDFVLLSSPEYL